MDFFNMIKQLVVLMSLIFAQTSGFDKTEWVRQAADQDPENSNSYLDWPRIHFYGTVLIGPPTGNNDCQNYDIETFDERLREKPSLFSWNPYGSGIFQFKDCNVTSVCYIMGGCVTNSSDDSLIGRNITNNINRSQANIVDLDPEYQNASTIFGLTLHIPGVFTAHLLEAAIKDLFVKIPSGEKNERFGGDFLSLLVDVEWENNVTDSQIVNEFGGLSSSSKPRVLSIKFNIELDSSRPYFKSAGFQIGRIAGTIGLAGTAEPLHSLRHRQLFPLDNKHDFGKVYFRVFKNRRELLIDIANAVQHNLNGLPDPDLNQILQIAYPSDETTDPVSCGTQITVVGQVNYTSKLWYQRTAGVISLPESAHLTSKQLDEISNRPLMIRRLDRRSLQCVQVILAERSDGIMIDVMGDRIFRQDPGDKWQVDAFSTKFGEPLANVPLQIKTAEWVQQDSHCGPNNTIIPYNQPANVVIYSNMATTNEHGIAVFYFTGQSPGNPRKIVDGQLYFFDILADVNHPATSNQPIAVHMYDDFRVSEGGPTWYQDIYPIFKLYANMFPSMTNIINLACYEDVRRKTKMINMTMALPITDPAYMPVTRDLSGQKRQAILKWLNNQTIGEPVPSSLEELKKNLQIALEFELSTIPPYLTALFSIKKDHNTVVASILQSIVIDEMLHMTLVANILNSICGNPILDEVGVIPKYPSKLPGGVHPHLTVSLGRLSKGLIEDVFMKIEEPDDTLPTEVREALLQGALYEDKVYHHNNTIGQFYIKIWKLLSDLNKVDGNLFKCGKSNMQITEDDWYSNVDEKPFRVSNFEDAVKAIIKIITEGEGSSPTQPNDSDGKLSHYYKLFEIVVGNKIKNETTMNYIDSCDAITITYTVRSCGGQSKPCQRAPYSFTGERVPFHDDGIWPIINDPEDHKYPAGSEVKQLSDLFNNQYSNLLRCIHGAFNGNPRGIKTCMLIMARRGSLGRQLASTPIDSNGDQNIGPNGAPTFEYIAEDILSSPNN